MPIFATASDMVSDEESSLSGDDVSVGDADADHTNLDDLKHSSWNSDRFWDEMARAHMLSLLETICNFVARAPKEK